MAAAWAAAALLVARTGAEPLTLATVLERAGAYVADFHGKLSSIVAEERYVQDWERVLDLNPPSGSRDDPRPDDK